MSYRQDREWADQHMTRVKGIIGPYLLMPAPLERDVSEVADLIVLRARDMTIAVRLRRRERRFWATHPHQFTLRCKRDNGTTTELSKIVHGWGDWFFYGHAEGDVLDPWMLLDLSGLREAFIRDPSLLRRPDGKRSGVQDNHDGTHFAYFDRSRLPSYVTVATSEPTDLLVFAESRFDPWGPTP
jgi:hypothetical protein